MSRKLMLAVPVSPDGAVDAHLVEWLLSVRVDGWEIVRTLVRNAPVVQARNALVKEFLATDCDVLMTIDSDQIPKLSPTDTTGGLERMLENIERDDIDILNVITVRGASGEAPILVLNRLREDMACELYEEILEKPSGLHRMDDRGVIGAAGVMIKRHVLERFEEDGTLWFYDVIVKEKGKHFSKHDGRDLYGERLIGHDYWFIRRANQFGFSVWVDTSIFWGHAKTSDLRGEFLRSLSLKKKIKELTEAMA